LKIDVVAIGEVCLDVITSNIPSILNRNITLNDITVTAGGMAVWFSRGIKSLNFRPGIISKIGKDHVGMFILKILQEEGIDTRGIKLSNVKTSVCIGLILSDGLKRFIGMLPPRLESDDIDLNYITQAKALHMAGYFLYPSLWGDNLRKIFKYAKKEGLLISLDTQSSSYARSISRQKLQSILKSVLDFVDVLLLDENEGELITGSDEPTTILERLSNLGANLIGLKLGRKGSMVFLNGKIYEIQAFDAPLKDTVGSGDIWDAGFLIGLLKRLEPKDAALVANAAVVLNKGLREKDRLNAMKFMQEKIM